MRLLGCGILNRESMSALWKDTQALSNILLFIQMGKCWPVVEQIWSLNCGTCKPSLFRKHWQVMNMKCQGLRGSHNTATFYSVVQENLLFVCGTPYLAHVSSRFNKACKIGLKEWLSHKTGNFSAPPPTQLLFGTLSRFWRGELTPCKRFKLVWMSMSTRLIVLRGLLKRLRARLNNLSILVIIYPSWCLRLIRQKIQTLTRINLMKNKKQQVKKWQKTVSKISNSN